MNKHLIRIVLLVFTIPAFAGDDTLWRGVDLSYVNELEDCGAEYRVGDTVMDPYHMFAGLGANVVRLRLWHTPTWTNYSTLDDVQKSIQRAHKAGMRVLLDIHYSDDWADPGDQIIPSAWKDAQDTEELAKRVYDYTLEVMTALDALGLTPEFVQVGNEINTEILLAEPVPEDTPIDWARNAALINAGIRAVRDFSEKAVTKPEIMLHIAQPEYVEPWLDDALAAGIEAFDILGVSYYPKWSDVSFADIGEAIRKFRDQYDKEVVVVETAYPWTLASNDEAGNLLGEDSLEEGYPATIDGQRRFLIDLMQSVVNGGGLGIVYWEPAWVSTDCRTRWGKGSHWENATLFHFDNTQLHQGAQFLGRDYTDSAK